MNGRDLQVCNDCVYIFGIQLILFHILSFFMASVWPASLQLLTLLYQNVSP